MIKVLMVDDEKMVRKGIISIMNWQKHNMIVVGEASNGRSALEFLKDNHVDLLITDLTMPGLCGLEFIKRVRKEYPSLHIVISTIHQEFDIIQEALQYDILDYITKSQIETNNTDEILERISKRIKQKKTQNKNVLIREKEDFNNYIILYSPNENNASQVDELSYKLQMPIRQLDMKLSLIHNGCERNLITYLSKEWIAFQIVSNNQIDINTLLKAVNKYINNDLFYEYSDNNKIYKCNIDNLNSTESILDNRRMDKIGQQMKELTWIYSEVVFDKNIKNILELNLNKQEMKRLMNLLLIQWSIYINHDMASYYERLSYLSYWYEYRLLLDDIRDNIRQCIHIEDTKEETIKLIEEAISYIHINYNSEISLKDILDIVHMSKSYFSKVFKQVTNKTYTNYLKELRIEKAKKMLVESNENIYHIGQKVGYKNEKYFRKTFKEVTGLQPRKYRNLKK